MKKKIAAMLTAAMVLTLGSTSIFAATSPTTVTTTAGTTVTLEGGFEATEITIEAAKDNTVAMKKADAVKPANAVGPGTVLVSQDVNPTTAAKVTRGGKEVYEVDFRFDSPAANTAYVVLLWNKDTNSWDVVESAFENGVLKAYCEHLTPMKVVTYPVADTSAYNSAYDNGYWQGVADTKAQAAAAAAAGNMVASPKTGETASLLPVIALLGAAGVVFCTRKSVMSR